MHLLKPSHQNEEGTVTIWYTPGRGLKITRSRRTADAPASEWYYHVSRRAEDGCYEFAEELSGWGDIGRARLRDYYEAILYEIDAEPSPEPDAHPNSAGYRAVLHFHGLHERDEPWWADQDRNYPEGW